ncbi:unnamed protein product [Ixodes pacificus]
MPSASTRMCSAHFVSNCRNDAEAHPSYSQTILPLVTKENAPNTERAKRLLKKLGQLQPQSPPVETPSVPSMTPGSEDTAKDNENATNWDPLQIVGTLPAAAPPGPIPLHLQSPLRKHCDSTPLTEGSLRLLLSTTDGQDRSTQVTHAEQVDAVI